MKRQIYIHREIEPALKNMARQFPAVALTGPRQSGKSTLLKKMFGKGHQFVSFDGPLVRQKAVSDPKLFLDSIKEPVIFDEIQYVPEILSYIKILIDKKRQKRGRFIFTGSQQFNLIKNLGDSLAGRIGILNLLPFSKAEKKTAFSSKSTFSQKYFIDACLRGSFPEPSVYPGIDSHAWYSSYIQTYLERDVRSVYEIGNLRKFQRFLQLLATRCSQVLNLSSLASDLGISVNTAKRWTSVLEASQLIYLLAPYYRNLGKRITKASKVYFLDCGLVCYLTGIKDSDYLLNGPMAGPLFENYVIQETVKSFFNQGQRPDIFYLRTHNEVEVDLIIERNMRIYPFEIKLTKTPNVSMAGHMQRFKNIFSKFDIMPARILCLSENDEILARGVSVTSLDSYMKWLRAKK